MQLPDDIVARHLVGGGRKGHDGHFGELLVEHAQLCVFRSEIVAPLRDAMCLVDGEERDADVLQQKVFLGQ